VTILTDIRRSASYMDANVSIIADLQVMFLPPFDGYTLLALDLGQTGRHRLRRPKSTP